MQQSSWAGCCGSLTTSCLTHWDTLMHYWWMVNDIICQVFTAYLAESAAYPCVSVTEEDVHSPPVIILKGGSNSNVLESISVQICKAGYGGAKSAHGWCCHIQSSFQLCLWEMTTQVNLLRQQKCIYSEPEASSEPPPHQSVCRRRPGPLSSLDAGKTEELPPAGSQCYRLSRYLLSTALRQSRSQSENVCACKWLI